MLARRRQLDMVLEPCYDMAEVPRCSKDLADSVVLRVTDRDQWIRSMPELVLLCNEATARSGASGGETNGHDKPIDLEYLADRLDTDDPLRGYVARSSALDSQGWMQGFITCTNFTTWSRYFCWDSLAHEAGVLDDAEDGKRACDVDGQLARELMNHVHEGDPHGEGVVWPHLAEISLLGGLGCGGWLLKVVLEELEQPGSPYEHVILQASENSVGFYEHHGFVRVGAITRYEDAGNPADDVGGDSISDDDGTIQSPPADGDEKPPLVFGRHCSPTLNCCAKDNESPAAVAKRMGVAVKDVVFLNRHVPGLTATSKLQAGTQLRIPDLSQTKNKVIPEWNPTLPAYYTAKDNETPRKIAQKLRIDPKALVALNKRHLKGLTQMSKLKPDSQLRIPGPGGDVPAAGDWLEWTMHGDVTGYRHWTFADEHETAIENTGVSYMMVRRLKITAGKRRANGLLEVSAGSMLEQLQNKLVDTAPPFKVTRAGIGIDTGKTPLPKTAEEQEAEAARKRALEADKEAAQQAAEDFVEGLPVSGEAAAALKQVLKKLKAHAAAEPFLEPVPQEVPNYYEQISQPISLACMHKKLHARPKSQYKIWKEFESDLSLLFQNCHTFNHDAPHGMYYMSMSAALKAYAKKELGAAKARFSELVQETDNANMKKRKAAPSSTGSSARSLREGVSMRDVWNAVRNAAAPDGRPLAELFLQLPNRQLYPDYFKLIKKPVALDQIRRRIGGSMRPYGVDQMLADLASMFTNARIYNQPGSQICLDVDVLQAIVAGFVKTSKSQVSNRASIDSPAVRALEKERPIPPQPLGVLASPWGLAKRAELRASKDPPMDATAAEESSLDQMVQNAWDQLDAAEQARHKAVDRVRLSRQQDAYEKLLVVFEQKMQDAIQNPNMVSAETIQKVEAALAELQLTKPEKPKGTQTAFFVFCGDHRRPLMASRKDLTPRNASCELAVMWKQLSDESKAEYHARSKVLKESNRKEMEAYKAALEKWEAEEKVLLAQLPPRAPVSSASSSGSDHSGIEDTALGANAKKAKKESAKEKLFNKVVMVADEKRAGNMPFYVLTYIPDLAWCRVARMRPDGFFGADRERQCRGVTGRVRWKLEPEGAGAELDVSALRCTVVRSRAVKRTQNADKEEWDIMEDLISKPEAVVTTGSADSRAAAGLSTVKHDSNAAGAVTGSAFAHVPSPVGADGWQFDGHPHIGQRVKGKWTTATESAGLIVAWLPEGENPAEDFALWRVVHDDGQEEDLEEHEVSAGIRAAAGLPSVPEDIEAVRGEETESAPPMASPSEPAPSRRRSSRGQPASGSATNTQATDRGASPPGSSPDSISGASDGGLSEEDEQSRISPQTGPTKSVTTVQAVASVSENEVNAGTEAAISSSASGRIRKAPVKFSESKFRGSCDSKRKDTRFDVVDETRASSLPPLDSKRAKIEGGITNLFWS